MSRTPWLHRALIGRALRWAATALLASTLIIALLLGAFSMVMAHLPTYRIQLQGWLSRQVHLDIRFSGLSARWRHFGPELVLTNAMVRTADGARTLVIARHVSAGLDIWNSLRSGHLATGRYELTGVELKAIRRTDGRFEIVGEADWPQPDRIESIDLSALPIGLMTVEDVRLSFRDLRSGRGPWVIDHISLTIKRDSSTLSVAGQASLPPVLGDTLRFTAHASGDVRDTDHLAWTAQLADERLDLAGWAKVMPEDWIAPRQGSGSLSLNASLIGASLQLFQGTVHFTDVLLPQNGTPVEQFPAGNVRQPAAARVYSRLSATFNTTRAVGGWHTQFDKLQLSRKGFDWQPGSASIDLKRTGADGMTLRVRAQSIVIDNVWPLFGWLPDRTVPQAWRGLNVTGRLGNLDLLLERDAPDTKFRYDLHCDFQHLGASPTGEMPGITGLSGSVRAGSASGELRLDSTDATLTLPALFRAPLRAAHLRGTLTWTQDDAGVQLRSKDLVVDNADGTVATQFSLQWPQGAAATTARAGSAGPVIDLRAQGRNLDAAAAPRYVPAGITPPALLTWLDAAFPSGRVRQAQLRLQGPLRRFPFRTGGGLFLVTADIDGLTLNYQPGWLPATGLRVAAEFRNAAFRGVVSEGEISRLRIGNATARIANLFEPRLELRAQASSDLANVLHFVQQSPQGPAIGDLFQHLHGQGTSNTVVDLVLPFNDPNRSTVDIDLALHDASVGVAGLSQRATDLNGSLHLATDTVTAATLRGTALMGRFNATIPAGQHDIVFNGRALAGPLAVLLQLPTSTTITGATDYRITVPGSLSDGGDGSRRVLAVDSDLRGLAIALPAPLLKLQDATASLHTEVQLQGGGEMDIRTSLDRIRSLLRFRHDGAGWRLERGSLRADGIAATLPTTPGLRVEGVLDTLALEEWLALGKEDDVRRAAQPLVQNALHSADVTIGTLHMGGFDFSGVHGVLQATDAAWLIDVDGPDAGGHISIPRDAAPGQELILDMNHLNLTLARPETGARTNLAAIDPRELPPLRATVQLMRIAQRDVGTLRVQGQPTTGGWLLDSLSLAGASFSGTAHGSWLRDNGGTRSEIGFALTSTDVGKTFGQLGYDEVVTAKRGRLEGDLRWPGGVEGNPLQRATGHLTLEIGDGQLLTVHPGPGKVLGLLSIAALPRRLRMDFRDIVDRGLIFDSIQGDFTVTAGDAHTQNLILRGPTAEIGIAGRIGLVTQDYDQIAAVSGDFGSALPVAGAALAVNPILRGALLLGTELFKGKLKGVARAYYHIGGDWEDPKVERLDANNARASEAHSATESEDTH